MLNGLDDFFATRMSALDLRAQRSEMLAANVANADTPNYKARDFDFPSALQTAISRSPLSAQSVALNRTSAQHIPGGSHGSGVLNLQYRNPAQSSVDGNTVDLDDELGQFSQNSIAYQADLTFLSNQLRLLQQAVTG